jgi:hypothetical protein
MKDKEYVGYEYKDIITNRDMEGLYADAYPSFGWELEGGGPSIVAGLTGSGAVNLKFKRDRKIKNKMELTRLQRQFENYAEDVCNLEKSKYTSATIVASVYGLIGAVMIALSVFLISDMLSAAEYTMPLVVLTGAVGLLCWVLLYPALKRQKAKAAAKANPLIEQKYDSINEACEKGHILLMAD